MREKSFIEILEEINSTSPALSIESMALLVNYKKIKRAKKGLEFNCHVLHRNDLAEFLMGISHCTNHRCQIIYYSPIHWSVADIEIIDGTVSIYLLDAGKIDFTEPDEFRKVFPKSRITITAGYIQFDSINYPSFSLDHAGRLAKIADLHTILKASADCKETDGETLRYTLAASDFPCELAPLLRYMQSYSRLLSLFKRPELAAAKGNDSLSFSDYVQRNLLKAGEDVYNNGIVSKRAMLRGKAYRFFNTADPYLSLKMDSLTEPSRTESAVAEEGLAANPFSIEALDF